MKQFLHLYFVLFVSTSAINQPPYSVTIFIDPDIITSSDPSALVSTTYTGQGMVWMDI